MFESISLPVLSTMNWFAYEKHDTNKFSLLDLDGLTMHPGPWRARPQGAQLGHPLQI